VGPKSLGKTPTKVPYRAWEITYASMAADEILPQPEAAGMSRPPSLFAMDPKVDLNNG